MVTDGRLENRRLTYDVELAAGTYRLARRPD
jgi:hypothetical protein